MPEIRTAPNLRFYWADPEPEYVAQTIADLSLQLEDFEEPLQAAGALIRSDIKQRFYTGTDPVHRPWQEWAETYEPWAIKHTTGPVLPGRANLHLTGEMERAVLNPINWVANASLTGVGSLFLITANLPPYWAWNNFGAMRQSPSAKEFEREEGEKALFGQNELPERAFVGVTPEAQAGIQAIFDAWMDHRVRIATSTRGKRHFAHAERGAGGRFVPATYK